MTTAPNVMPGRNAVLPALCQTDQPAAPGNRTGDSIDGAIDNGHIDMFPHPCAADRSDDQGTVVGFIDIPLVQRQLVRGAPLFRGRSGQTGFSTYR